MNRLYDRRLERGMRHRDHDRGLYSPMQEVYTAIKMIDHKAAKLENLYL